MSESLKHGLSIINKNYKLVIEFGVWQGNTMKIIRNSLNKDYCIYGFDSFEGMPEHETTIDNAVLISESDIDKVYSNGVTKDLILKPGVFSTNGKVPDIQNVTWYKGWFNDTLPKFVKDVSIQPAALIHIDCDHYFSTKTIFEYMTPYIKKDTILVFDEWNMDATNKTPHHEEKAFNEWVNANNINFRFIKFFDISSKFHEERKIVKII